MLRFALPALRVVDIVATKAEKMDGDHGGNAEGGHSRVDFRSVPQSA